VSCCFLGLPSLVQQLSIMCHAPAHPLLSRIKLQPFFSQPMPFRQALSSALSSSAAFIQWYNWVVSLSLRLREFLSFNTYTHTPISKQVKLGIPKTIFHSITFRLSRHAEKLRMKVVLKDGFIYLPATHLSRFTIVILLHVDTGRSVKSMVLANLASKCPTQMK